MCLLFYYFLLRYFKWYTILLIYVIGNCCYVVVVRQEFRKKFLLVFAAEQTLIYMIGISYHIKVYAHAEAVENCRLCDASAARECALHILCSI